MERKHFYITFYSNASQKLYPDNTQTAFTCHLAQPIYLGTSSDWDVGLSEVSYFPPKRVVMKGSVIDYISTLNGLIYCDLIAPQFVGENKVRVIRPIIVWPATGIQLYHNIYYFPVEKSEFQDIRIEIKKLDGEPPEFQKTDVPVKVVLHFRSI